MKEAAGEANITVITIVLIAIVLAIGAPIVTNMLEANKMSSCCNAAGGKLQANKEGRNGKSCYDSKGNLIGWEKWWDGQKKECKLK